MSAGLQPRQQDRATFRRGDRVPVRGSHTEVQRWSRRRGRAMGDAVQGESDLIPVIPQARGRWLALDALDAAAVGGPAGEGALDRYIGHRRKHDDDSAGEADAGRAGAGRAGAGRAVVSRKREKKGGGPRGEKRGRTGA